MLAKLQATHQGFTARQRGGVTHLVGQRRTTNLGRVIDRLAALGGVHDKLNLVGLQHVDNVWAAFQDLVDDFHLKSGSLHRLRGATGRRHFEPQSLQGFGQLNRAGLIAVTHRYKGTTTARYFFTCPGGCFGKGFGEAFAHPHDLASGFHFWPQNRIDALEFGEREHRLFDAVIRRDDFLGESLAGQ